ncbi:HSP20-like chaperone [Scheffersomyces coipomensis]|uniref:HSP20-like chaperone n=1 Tax=Scheffersomyces coipomensis TaxID=1788519 RepID=UPI00315DCC09
MATTVTPNVLWAQRSSESDESKNVLYVTIEVLDPTNIKLDLTSTHLKLTADSQDNSNHYNLDIEFFDEVDPEKSHKNTESGSHIYLVIRKKTAQEEFWPRLTKQKLKYHYIKTDFDKWVDEDEQNEVPEQEDETANMMNFGGPGGPGAPGGLDFSQLMAGAGGAGGAGGFDFSQLMGGAGGAGGPGGLPGNFDISALASQLGQAGGAKLGEDDEEDDDEDEDEDEDDDDEEEVEEVTE